MTLSKWFMNPPGKVLAFTGTQRSPNFCPLLNIVKIFPFKLQFSLNRKHYHQHQLLAKRCSQITYKKYQLLEFQALIMSYAHRINFFNFWNLVRIIIFFAIFAHVILHGTNNQCLKTPLPITLKCRKSTAIFKFAKYFDIGFCSRFSTFFA